MNTTSKLFIYNLFGLSLGRVPEFMLSIEHQVSRKPNSLYNCHLFASQGVAAVISHIDSNPWKLTKVSHGDESFPVSLDIGDFTGACKQGLTLANDPHSLLYSALRRAFLEAGQELPISTSLTITVPRLAGDLVINQDTSSLISFLNPVARAYLSTSDPQRSTIIANATESACVLRSTQTSQTVTVWPGNHMISMWIPRAAGDRKEFQFYSIRPIPSLPLGAEDLAAMVDVDAIVYSAEDLNLVVESFEFGGRTITISTSTPYQVMSMAIALETNHHMLGDDDKSIEQVEEVSKDHGTNSVAKVWTVQALECYSVRGDKLRRQELKDKAEPRLVQFLRLLNSKSSRWDDGLLHVLDLLSFVDYRSLCESTLVVST